MQLLGQPVPGRRRRQHWAQARTGAVTASSRVSGHSGQRLYGMSGKICEVPSNFAREVARLDDQGCNRSSRPLATRIRLCMRFSRPCQNSTISGAMR
ncbi:Uncharacterised protein [Mycobacterium tuberculosis]|uniref:Uncharacterized protein n=1 Tax=Mycobacterium tuberculosis TaxID=1773 RepID=A0A654TPI1_MYCTX|nr:Uncharacterised protein [Mycobacterium tuberculosis]